MVPVFRADTADLPTRVPPGIKDPQGTPSTAEDESDPSGALREVCDGPRGVRNADLVRRMLQLLGPHGTGTGAGTGVEPGSGGRGTSVEDFPPLLGEHYLERSSHAAAAKMRARLFQVGRVYEGSKGKAPAQRLGVQGAGVPLPEPTRAPNRSESWGTL